MKDCTVCGHPRFRPEGHAEWCERLTYLLANEAKLGPVKFNPPPRRKAVLKIRERPAELVLRVPEFDLAV